MTTGPSAITGPSMSKHDEIMTTDEVARCSGCVPKRMLYRWMQQGTSPPHYAVGKHARSKRREVQAWFDARLVDERSS